MLTPAEHAELSDLVRAYRRTLRESEKAVQRPESMSDADAGAAFTAEADAGAALYTRLAELTDWSVPARRPEVVPT